MLLHVSSTVVLIIRRSKFYYTASGIVTMKQEIGLKLFLCFAERASQYNVNN